MQKKNVVLIVAGLLGLAIIGKLTEQPEAETAAPALTQQQLDSIAFEKRVEKAKEEAAVNMRVAVQKSLNDPKSFDVLDQRAWHIDSSIYVMLEYTARNAFGGVVRQVAKVEADLDGRLLRFYE